MKEKIIDILEKHSTPTDHLFDYVSAIKFPEIADEIIKLFEPEKEVEIPKLIGHLNTKFGYNGFKEIEIIGNIY